MKKRQEIINNINNLKTYAIEQGFDYPTQEITDDIPTEVLADFRVEIIDYLSRPERWRK